MWPFKINTHIWFVWCVQASMEIDEDEVAYRSMQHKGLMFFLATHTHTHYFMIGTCRQAWRLTRMRRDTAACSKDLITHTHTYGLFALVRAGKHGD
jgi:hypothetical protein